MSLKDVTLKVKLEKVMITNPTDQVVGYVATPAPGSRLEERTGTVLAFQVEEVDFFPIPQAVQVTVTLRARGEEDRTELVTLYVDHALQD